MGYKKDAIKGISWIGFLSFATKAVGFLEAIILARILIPSQFGAYGVALLALGLLEVITQSGVNIFLIQEKEIDDYINSAWIVSIVRGVLIMSILFFLAPVISNFFHSPESLHLLLLISLVPLIRGFINPSIVKLQKELKFGRDFFYRFTVLVVDTLISVVATFITKSPIGIVIGLLTGVVLELVLSFALVAPRPALRFEVSYIRKIFNRGKWITASSIFDYLFHNADNIVVGRMLGASALGVYQLAYSLAAVPLIEIGRVFVHVTVPIMIKISGNTRRLRDAYLQTVIAIFLITIPFTLLFAFAPSIFVRILGAKWAAITLVLPILSLVGFVKSISLSSTALFLSQNKQEYTTLITFVNILGLIVSIVPLVLSYGIFGAGLSALIGSLVALPFIIFYTYKTFSNSKTK